VSTQIATRESSDLAYLNLESNEHTLWNLTPNELYEETIKNDKAKLTSDYALRILAGEYTGRSPKDKFIVDPTLYS
jgi:phosphoenolpyruvate carboxykinase (ATP)